MSTNDQCEIQGVTDNPERSIQIHPPLPTKLKSHLRRRKWRYIFTSVIFVPILCLCSVPKPPNFEVLVSKGGGKFQITDGYETYNNVELIGNKLKIGFPYMIGGLLSSGDPQDSDARVYLAPHSEIVLLGDLQIDDETYHAGDRLTVADDYTNTLRKESSKERMWNSIKYHVANIRSIGYWTHFQWSKSVGEKILANNSLFGDAFVRQVEHARQECGEEMKIGGSSLKLESILVGVPEQFRVRISDVENKYGKADKIKADIQSYDRIDFQVKEIDGESRVVGIIVRCT